MAIPEFFFAWIDTPVAFSEVTHAVKSEPIVLLNRILTENDFPSLTITIEHPTDALLAPGKKRWAWVSYRKMSGTIVPLFLGWLVGEPENIAENTITITLTARPSDFAEQKEALAVGMRNLPEFDVVFIKEEERGDPDHVLQGRPFAWHMSHLFPLTVSTSHLVVGEDGNVVFQSGSQVDYSSVKRSLRHVPARKAKMTAEVAWLQSANGQVNVKKPLLDAAKAAGTTVDGMVTSYTGQGLIDDWPKEDDNIGSGWRVKEASAEFITQVEKAVPLSELPTSGGISNDPTLNYLMSLSGVPGIALFYLWHIAPTFIAKYEVSRRRQETIIFTMEADIQPVLTEPGDEEVIELSASAVDLTELIDVGGTLAPIRDARRAAYFPTTRGKQSLEYLMNVASTQLISRARCVEVEFKVRFEDALDLTCRMNATLVDPRFPGGAVGKVVGVSLLADPNGGEFSCTIRIAASVGEGNIVVAALGEALYIDDDYIDESYYVRTGETYAISEGNLTYEDFSHIPPNDDGTDFFNMTWQHAVLSATLVNGETVQEAVLDSKLWLDIGEAVDALVAVPSEFQLVLRPLEGSFVTEYNVVTSGLMITKTIDLRAVA